MIRKRILLVEDSKLPQMIVKTHFEKLHCRVDIAETGEAGIEYCRKNRYDLIIMDIGLPGIDGISAAAIIRGQSNPNQQVPIVALTAHDDPTFKAKALAVGMNDYLIKPLTFAAAQAMMIQYCGRDNTDASPGMQRKGH